MINENDSSTNRLWEDATRVVGDHRRSLIVREILSSGRLPRGRCLGSPWRLTHFGPWLTCSCVNARWRKLHRSITLPPSTTAGGPVGQRDSLLWTSALHCIVNVFSLSILSYPDASIDSVGNVSQQMGTFSGLFLSSTPFIVNIVGQRKAVPMNRDLEEGTGSSSRARSKSSGASLQTTNSTRSPASATGSSVASRAIRCQERRGGETS